MGVLNLPYLDATAMVESDSMQAGNYHENVSFICYIIHRPWPERERKTPSHGSLAIYSFSLIPTQAGVFKTCYISEWNPCNTLQPDHDLPSGNSSTLQVHSCLQILQPLACDQWLG